MNAVTMKELIVQLDETVDESNLTHREWIDFVKEKQTKKNLDTLVFPDYVRNLPFKNLLQMVMNYMTLSKVDIRHTINYVGDIGFEMVLKDRKRLFNVELYRSESKSRQEQINTYEEAMQVLEEVGAVYALATDCKIENEDYMVFNEDNEEPSDEIFWGVVTKQSIERLSFVVIGKPSADLNQVLSASEAATLWGFERSVVRKAIERGRFKEGEYRKSEGTWFVTYYGMQRAFGAIPIKG
ncbi:helix-turn-helix domain-containing protein (plasmid) [Aneurinibacillus sp. Ricciae_BoGa-3]|uniref:helix-turn-helix domain-containing protein n=1 Tax=Aneurinibacillus sp. Ricciae_BoGa-3 TaxID=3022697 RepID=UPI002341449F|nr:helix-turn-helix domain-containing protein [Aneurinibacillus sp. Ricciae_BoGa-3]WCK57555.1 helix-turn-helix domain-containing protein [Aneurinibacillus sp. Ricciae_BoGa-3]